MKKVVLFFMLMFILSLNRMVYVRTVDIAEITFNPEIRDTTDNRYYYIEINDTTGSRYNTRMIMMATTDYVDGQFYKTKPNSPIWDFVEYTPYALTNIIGIFVVDDSNGEPIGTYRAFYMFKLLILRNESFYLIRLSFENYSYSGGQWTLYNTNTLLVKSLINVKYSLFGFYGGRIGGCGSTVFVSLYGAGNESLLKYTFGLDTYHPNKWFISAKPSIALQNFTTLYIKAIYLLNKTITEIRTRISNILDPDYELTIPDKLSTPSIIEHVDIPTPPSDISWEYSSWSLQESNKERLTIGNPIELQVNLADGQNLFNLTTEPWEMEFTHIELKSTTNYFTYNFTKSTSWGDWGVWNWLRDGLVAVVNVLEWIYVAIAYAFTLVINGVWCLLLLIGLFVYETLIYWLYVGVLWLGWLIFIGLFYLFYIIIQGFILLTNLLIPLTLFMFNLINSVIAFVWACIVYLFYPTGDFWTIYNNMISVLTLFTNALALLIITILVYLPELISIFMYYGVFWGLAQIKKIWVKSKGFVKRTKQIEVVIENLEMPIRAVESLIYRIKRLIPIVG